MKPNKVKKAKTDKRGKYYRDPWLRILQLLAAMPYEERMRCLDATVNFYKGRSYDPR